MAKNFYERTFQDYLTKNNGANLKKIDCYLELIESEHKFKGGRIDILAKKESKTIGIELKYYNYNTRGVCAQLLNYLNYITPIGGEVYFIAPKIKYGLYSTLKSFYDDNKLKFFEVTNTGNTYSFKELLPQYIDDSKQINYSLLKPNQDPCFETTEKIKRAISIILKDEKKAKLINCIIDDRKSREKKLEDITETILEIITPRKSCALKRVYKLIKLL